MTSRKINRAKAGRRIQESRFSETHYTVDDHAVRLIGLDTLVVGAAHGQIGTGRWRGMDGIGLVDAAAFAGIIPAVLAIYSCKSCNALKALGFQYRA